jgi:hypothetical protein
VRAARRSGENIAYGRDDLCTSYTSLHDHVQHLPCDFRTDTSYSGGGHITGLCACTALCGLWGRSSVSPAIDQHPAMCRQAGMWAGVSTFVPSLAVPLLPPSSYVPCELSCALYKPCPVVILVSFSLGSLRQGLVYLPPLPANCIRLLPDRCAVVPGYDAARTLSRTVVRL